jgi:hypothetical protein
MRTRERVLGEDERCKVGEGSTRGEGGRDIVDQSAVGDGPAKAAGSWQVSETLEWLQVSSHCPCLTGSG